MVLANVGGLGTPFFFLFVFFMCVFFVAWYWKLCGDKDAVILFAAYLKKKKKHYTQ